MDDNFLRFPSPVFGGGGAVIRDGGGRPQLPCPQVADHDVKSVGVAASTAPSVGVRRRHLPRDGGGSATPPRGVAVFWDSGEKPLCHRHPRRPTPAGIRWDSGGIRGTMRRAGGIGAI